MACIRVILIALFLVYQSYSQQLTGSNGTFTYPLKGSDFTINYNDVLIFSWQSEFTNPWLHAWARVDHYAVALNSSVASVGNYRWTFAPNVSNVEDFPTYPLRAHGEIVESNLEDHAKFNSGDFNITSTAEYPTTWSAKATTPSTESTSSGVVTQTITASASSAASPTAGPSALPEDTKAGIGVGVGVAIVASAVAGTMYFIRRKRRLQSSESHGSRDQMHDAEHSPSAPSQYAHTSDCAGICEADGNRSHHTRLFQEISGEASVNELPEERSIIELPGGKCISELPSSEQQWI
ncbi:MAG: hypothetical protein M1820_007208 [Bogoriella megaspora]|nr:MAG: hypothetical protein M1820_007208 [Bogoriella megaspora]